MAGHASAVEHQATDTADRRCHDMAYELRIAGQASECFDRAEDAQARARDLLRQDADTRVEIFDLNTGRPYAPAASAEDGEDMARKVGF
ncbi:MAG: hypothetical protein B7Z80_08005 [Rhodospirillales bacterium 20-64-7]|nr:MAG: hypothetical protein B7Z80_08005 [Rhodospirillales bacterium 20-64-7]